jgi:4-hydroxy-3-polyprenylbenzoate decarboxylase
MSNPKIVVAITGASGTIYALRLLQVLKSLNVYVEAVYTRSSARVAEAECLDRERFLEFLRRYANKVYSEDEFEAPLSSSSYLADFAGVAIVPTSLNTLAKVAHGIADNLVTRVALNGLRLRKRVVFLLRETPLGVIELRNALIVARAGGIILPASPGFYHNPKDVMDLIDFVVGKVLDALEIKHNLYARWEGYSRGRDLCSTIFSEVKE